MNTLKKFKKYMGGRGALLPISLILSGLNGILSIVPYIFIWLIIRELLMGEGSIEGTPAYTYAWCAAAAAIAGVLVYFTSLILSHIAAFRVEINLRRSAMQKVMKMPLGYFTKKLSGRMRKVIDEDSSQTHTFLAHILPDLAASIMVPAIIVIMVFAFEWRLGLACLIPILVNFIMMGRMLSSKYNKFQRAYIEALEKMSGEAVEYVRGIPVVKVFQQTVYSFKRFYDSIIEYRDMVSEYSRMMQVNMSVYTTMVHGFSFFLVPTAFIIITSTGNTATIIADLLLYLMITPMLSSHIMKIMYLRHNLFLANEGITRIEKLTGEKTMKMPQVPRIPSMNAVTFDNVRFRYPSAREEAVKGINFTIPAGQTYALVGPSGGGKSTIAKLIPRFWDATEGAVRIGGIDVRNVAKEQLMKKVSFVFQNVKLFKTTVRENIIYGKPDASQEEIDRAINLSQSRSIIDKLPDGLNTKIGAGGVYLSGGEQQHIVLARAILKNAPIIVLDEATAYAYPESEAHLKEALRELMKGKTALLIAHRLTSVQHVNKILVINNGEIAEQGTHVQLLNEKGLYHDMWNEFQRSVAWTIASS